MPDISLPTAEVPQKKPKVPLKPSIVQRRTRPRPIQAPAEISKIKMVQNPTTSESIVGIRGFVIGQPIKIKKTQQKHLEIDENCPVHDNKAYISPVEASLLGTVKRPKLNTITTGQRVGKSLIYHTQEGTEWKLDPITGQMKEAVIYQKYTRKMVNKNSMTLRCTFHNKPISCKATLIVEPTDKGCIEKQIMGKGERNRFFLKTDEKWRQLMLNPDFWTVRERKLSDSPHTLHIHNFKINQPK